MNRSFQAISILIFVSLLTTGGCGSRWNDGMASYAPVLGDRSINGATVFEKMCTNAGHRTRRLGFTSDRYEKIDVVVWFCHADAAGPGVDSVAWFESWLRAKPGRTLVFVPRTYEATAAFWDATVSGARPEDETRAKEKHAQSRARRDAFLNPPFPGSSPGSGTARAFRPGPTPALGSPGASHSIPNESVSPWVRLKKREQALLVETLEGEEHWTKRTDRTTAPLEVLVSMLPGMAPPKPEAAPEKEEADPGTGESEAESTEEDSQENQEKPAVSLVNFAERDESFTVLLRGSGKSTGPSGSADPESEILIAEKKIGESRLLVVQSGNFLLNMPLVEPENRKLAGRLIALFGPPRKNIVLLLMGSGLVHHSADSFEYPNNTSLILLQIWPASLFFWHLVLIGIAAVFWRWPIFGRPLQAVVEPQADFEKHIEAYGEMLEKTGDRAYAYRQIERYLEQTEPK